VQLRTPISTGSVELGSSPAPMQNGKAAAIHHRMAFSLRFEENAERRQRLRLAQQSRKRRARDTDASPHHLEPSDHQFASVSAMAASANAFVPDAWSLIALLDLEVLQGVRHPTQPQPAHSACVFGRRSMEPEKYCGPRFLRYFNRLRLGLGNGRNRVERHAVMAVKFSRRTHHEPQAKQVSSFPAVGTGRSEGLGDHRIDRRQQLSPGLGSASHRIVRRQGHPQTTRGT
jgi:hypothetical protein